MSTNERLGLRLAVTLGAFAAAATIGCASPSSEDDAASSMAAVTESSSATQVASALTTLHAQRSTGQLAKYYADGARVAACWANPAGKKLTDLKKAFYCSMPLEFRICNTVVLLNSDDSDVDARYRGYLDCQSRVDAVFGSERRFVYSEAINQTYKDLFLRGESGLSPEAEAQLIDDNKPTSTHGFVFLLAETVKSLAVEAVDLGSAAFEKLVKDVISSASAPDKATGI